MKVRKHNKTAQVNPRTLKGFVGESEYGGKGGMAHAKPTGPMKGNPVHYGREKAVRPSKRKAKEIREELEKHS